MSTSTKYTGKSHPHALPEEDEASPITLEPATPDHSDSEAPNGTSSTIHLTDSADTAVRAATAAQSSLLTITSGIIQTIYNAKQSIHVKDVEPALVQLLDLRRRLELLGPQITRLQARTASAQAALTARQAEAYTAL